MQALLDIAQDNNYSNILELSTVTTAHSTVPCDQVWRNCKPIKSKTMTPIKKPYQSTEWLSTYRIPKKKKPSQATLETGTREYGTNVASIEL